MSARDARTMLKSSIPRLMWLLLAVTGSMQVQLMRLKDVPASTVNPTCQSSWWNGVGLAKLQLKHGPFLFDSLTIEEKVELNKIGNFVLGYARESTGGFIPKYAGRSDSDLRKELHAKLQAASKSRRLFKFDYAETVREAFEKECLHYHDFKKQLDNDKHPRRPEGTNYTCPVQDCDELA